MFYTCVFGLDISTIMRNLPGVFFGTTARLLVITPAHSELRNGPGRPCIPCPLVPGCTGGLSQYGPYLADGVLEVDAQQQGDSCSPILNPDCIPSTRAATHS